MMDAGEPSWSFGEVVGFGEADEISEPPLPLSLEKC